MGNKIRFYFFGLLLSQILIMGCVSIQYTKESKPAPASKVYRCGEYHTVKAGETLWRISRMYNIDLGELVNINSISDATSIEIGQQIFIPEAYAVSGGNTRESLEDFIWPLKGSVVNKFHEIRENMVNKGINIRPISDRQVVASRSGQVVFYDDDFNGFGKTVILEHPGGFMTVYACLQEVFVKVGERIAQGSAIASIGPAAGKKNNFLHFEIRKGHRAQNPIFYLPT